MKIPHCMLAALAAAPLLQAQAPHRAVLASDVGAVARLGTQVDDNAVAAGTAIGPNGFRIGARTGTRTGEAAFALTAIEHVASRAHGTGISVHQSGAVANADPTVRGAAGTTDNSPRTAPSFGDHEVRIAYPMASGQAAVVFVRFRGDSTQGASGFAALDVDGDGTADFAARANGQGQTAAIPVTAGARGVQLALRTGGQAAAAGGRARYELRVEVTVREGTLASSCAFTNFGTACGADLDGTVGANMDLSLDVTNTAANRFGMLVVGDQAATPRPLPFGSCTLLVDPNPRMFWMPFMTDASGAANLSIRTPSFAVTRSFQALVLDVDRQAQTRSLLASNGTELVCN